MVYNDRYISIHIFTRSLLVVVHCAAERRPDVAEQDHDGVLRVSIWPTFPRNSRVLTQVPVEC